TRAVRSPRKREQSFSISYVPFSFQFITCCSGCSDAQKTKIALDGARYLVGRGFAFCLGHPSARLRRFSGSPIAALNLCESGHGESAEKFAVKVRLGEAAETRTRSACARQSAVSARYVFPACVELLSMLFFP